VDYPILGGQHCPGRTNLMTENESRPEFFAGLMQPWIAQLHAITEELAGMTRVSQSARSQPLRSLQDLPLPGALSAAQLATVEEMVAPLVEWSKAWAEFESAAMNPGSGRRPEGEDSA